MIRRIFIKCGLGAIGLSILGASAKADNSWKNGPIDLIWNDNKKVWQVDPFTNVILKKGQLVVVGNKKFRQTPSGDCIVLTREDNHRTFNQWVPLTDEKEQKSAFEFIDLCEKEYNGHKVDYYRIFNEDKTRSNLYAECYFETVFVPASMVVNGSN